MVLKTNCETTVIHNLVTKAKWILSGGYVNSSAETWIYRFWGGNAVATTGISDQPNHLIHKDHVIVPWISLKEFLDYAIIDYPH